MGSSALSAIQTSLGETPVEETPVEETPVEEVKVTEPKKPDDKSEKAKAKNAANSDVLALMAKEKEARFTNKLQHPFYSKVVLSKLGMTPH